MKQQLQQIRGKLGPIADGDWDNEMYVIDRAKQALTALAELERMAVGQEPVDLDHIACIDDGELRYMTGRKAPAYDCELYAMPDGKRAPKLYATPPAQQPHDHVAVTWDAARTRILAVTLQDAEGRVLCVIDEAPAQQPQYEAGDMASAHNDGFRAGVASVAQQPQAKAVPSDAEIIEVLGDPKYTHITAVRELIRRTLAAPQQAEAVLSDAAVVAGARALCNRFADTGGVSREGQWNIYAEDFKDDARAVLNAAIAAAQGEKP